MSSDKRVSTASTPFPELPEPPRNADVAGMATSFFSHTTGASPTISEFYVQNPALLAKPAGPFSSAELGRQESLHVQQYGNPAHPTDQLAMSVPTAARMAAAGAVGLALQTAHKSLEMSHPDFDPSKAGGY